MRAVCVNPSCTQHNKAVAGHARFCKSCGQLLAVPVSEPLPWWMSAGLIVISLLLLTLLSGCKKTDDTATVSPSAPAPDRWQVNLAEIRKSYEQNQAKLRVDWRAALAEAQAGDLNADALDRDIVGLSAKLQRSTAALNEWDDQLVAEIEKRGLNAGTPHQ